MAVPQKQYDSLRKRMSTATKGARVKKTIGHLAQIGGGFTAGKMLGDRTISAGTMGEVPVACIGVAPRLLADFFGYEPKGKASILVEGFLELSQGAGVGGFYSLGKDY